MWIKDMYSAIYGQQKKVQLHSVNALLLFTSKIWTLHHFLIGLSKHFLSPPISSGASYLTLGKVSGGAPPILWNFPNGTMWGGDCRAGRSCKAGRCWGQGEAALVEEDEREEAVDDEVKMVRWREWGEKIYGKTVALLIGPDTILIRKRIVFANRGGNYIY